MSDVPSTADAPAFTLSSDPALLDREWIVREVKASYWGEPLTPEQILGALDESLVIGAYEAGKQIGFIRAVTDSHIWSSITDMLVEEPHRGKGVGTALLKAMVENDRMKKTLCILQARQAAWLWYYRHADFHVIDKAHGIMRRMPR
jgi:GNAT superfamily N-acetyltransferase